MAFVVENTTIGAEVLEQEVSNGPSGKAGKVPDDLGHSR
jgi:hypothetical protein